MNRERGHVEEAESLAAAGRWQEAAGAYATALTRTGSTYQLRLGHGLALMRIGRFEEAHHQFTHALQHEPNSPEALNNLAAALSRLGNSSAAEETCRRILADHPDHHAAWSNLGSALCRQGRVAEGLEAFGQALALAPDDRIIRDNLLLNLNYLATDGAELAEVHRILCGDLPSAPPRPHPDTAGRRIRIGYVSSDFRSHSVSFFMAGIIGTHDRDAFEVFCYSTTHAPDRRTEDFRHLAEHFVDLAASSNEEAARRIQADGIDILVDLGGHTSGNRLDIFAHRPAPLQVTYLGYPATTGCPFMDYRLVDALTDPDGAEALSTEHLIRLPAPFLCYLPHTTFPEIAPLPALTNGYITYGSFNHSAKISDDTLNLWSSVLAAAPDARLVIKAREFSDAAACTHLRRRFSERKVDLSRLTLLGHLENSQSHLAAYGQIDVALDTFPYHGTTTTCEALWMGVPVISLIGSLHAARVGLTLLNSVGLGGLATATEDEYVALALALAEDRDQLAQLRGRLRGIMERSPLCDRHRLTRELETALRTMLQP
jgi:predicted O-linked N-acetylglucosamine transferase (SPINDLY family)